jgi:hypothetical protein
VGDTDEPFRVQEVAPVQDQESVTDPPAMMLVFEVFNVHVGAGLLPDELETKTEAPPITGETFPCSTITNG